MKQKTSTERVAAARERMRAKGYVLTQVWLHPLDRQRALAYIRRLNKSRG